MGYGLALGRRRNQGGSPCGVLKALMEAGLRPDAVAGASAGGIVAGLFAPECLSPGWSRQCFIWRNTEASIWTRITAACWHLCPSC